MVNMRSAVYCRIYQVGSIHEWQYNRIHWLKFYLQRFYVLLVEVYMYSCSIHIVTSSTQYWTIIYRMTFHGSCCESTLVINVLSSFKSVKKRVGNKWQPPSHDVSYVSSLMTLIRLLYANQQLAYFCYHISVEIFLFHVSGRCTIEQWLQRLALFSTYVQTCVLVGFLCKILQKSIELVERKSFGRIS